MTGGLKPQKKSNGQGCPSSRTLKPVPLYQTAGPDCTAVQYLNHFGDYNATPNAVGGHSPQL